ncbi:glycosyl hydrolase family 61-domain-containing protein [Cercophora scortea]|uniref:lytic cellulose monooxygenase (C4-dehydrogenating) n=1 Tax=Cercophora scortea TaxID=314031 RepID=A0AAE0I8I8_9PEZI|nr:glycosyl hydrolase family 61-domain-containing protein [Cercophora scortea]
MHFTTTTLALALAATVSAHTTMFSVWVNGADQGDGRNVYIRSPPNNSPVKDLASTDLVCNVNGAKAVSSFVKAAAGSTLTFEWFHDNRGDDIIDGSHKGPIITYIAPFTTGNGASSIWTKIAEEGFDTSTKLWAVDKLKTNGGKKDFTLPAGLAAGKYLIRQEIIALHESDAAFNVNSVRGAQFYPSCVQIEVTGSGTAVPTQNFNFNTGYTYSDPGILFNLYGSFTSYTIPGPKVFAFSSSAPVVATTTTSKAVVVAPTTTSKAAVVVPTSTTKAAASTTTTRRPASPPTPVRGRPTRSRLAQAVTPTANPPAPVVTVVCAGNKGQ